MKTFINFDFGLTRNSTHQGAGKTEAGGSSRESHSTESQGGISSEGAQVSHGAAKRSCRSQGVKKAICYPTKKLQFFAKEVDHLSFAFLFRDSQRT